MSLASIMDNTLAYRLWQAPFVAEKFAPIAEHNDLSRVSRVLDVGCGPGTNAAYFANADYTGIDMSEQYIEHARQKFQRNFVCADVTQYRVPPSERFDFILLNSLLHHIDLEGVEKLLAHLATLLTEDGHIHIIELVLPEDASVARFLARADRGKYPRPLAQWKTIFTESFDCAVFEPFTLRRAGVDLWRLVYFKGRAKQECSKR
jgi:SAM-dependent methyltransferase